MSAHDYFSSRHGLLLRYENQCLADWQKTNSYNFSPSVVKQYQLFSLHGEQKSRAWEDVGCKTLVKNPKEALHTLQTWTINFSLGCFSLGSVTLSVAWSTGKQIKSQCLNCVSRWAKGKFSMTSLSARSLNKHLECSHIQKCLLRCTHNASFLF